MILFFRSNASPMYAVGTGRPLPDTDLHKLSWLFGNASPIKSETIDGPFIGPRREMVTPWSTNAVEITQTMGISGIERIEAFHPFSDGDSSDKMLQSIFHTLDQSLFTIQHKPDPILNVSDVSAFNRKEGLALSEEEVEYLNEVSKQLNRQLTDSEVFGFSQINSEHCRHKIFNGTFIIDHEQKKDTLFQLIKKTAKEHPNFLVSAYSDNVAFIEGPRVEQFAPKRQDKPDYFQIEDIDTVISIKAETHNFPTTVEPFNGAATGSGGEIRDRLAGGQGAIPLAGTAVYITSYPRLDNGRSWEKKFSARQWLYQSPAEILIKASDGASDFGNKFGQPLICGSLLTFEHFEKEVHLGFDKVIMLAGGIGFAKASHSLKKKLKTGDKIVLLGGDNYRIGMGGGAVSSVATGEYANAIELNAIQRSNPEMQKRVMNVIRAMAEATKNPIISIHDHGAGGHLNCFSELLEDTGGTIHIEALPVGDPTLSDKEIISNESQERMGLAIHERDIEEVQRISERERSPLYVVGTATGDQQLTFSNSKKNTVAFNLTTAHLFGASPKTILTDNYVDPGYNPIPYESDSFSHYLNQVLQLEAVACKDWLTNKVDRSVTGKVATQQTCGPIQLPLNNVGVMAMDFLSHKGVATSVGHAPGAALVNPIAGSHLAIAEALTNIVWAPLTHGLKGVSLSANWMWPAKNKGENARLYKAVEAVSQFACDLGINIPTGKDSLSMTQKYPNGDVVISPGTVIISATAEVSDLKLTVSPELKHSDASVIIYIDFSKSEYSLGGSSFAQALNYLGTDTPTVKDVPYFSKCFNTLQHLIKNGLILAGHDISEGGMITALAEMCFPVQDMGMTLDLMGLGDDLIKIAFSEKPGVLIQVDKMDDVESILKSQGVVYHIIGKPVAGRQLVINHLSTIQFNVDVLRETWFRTSYLFDQIQRPNGHAEKRKENYTKQPLHYSFPHHFDGTFSFYNIDPTRRVSTGVKAAIIREKGVNGDREMAYSLYLAGFDVRDVHMTDLVTGREALTDINLIVFVGGFSNSDVLGSAKGWAGSFLYNDKARMVLDNFYKRTDTLSLGVCNGCQLMMELGLVYRDADTLKKFNDAGWKEHPKMQVNGSGKFESTFINLTIPENNAVMLHSLKGSRLGAWVAHGEGRFSLPNDSSIYQTAAYYSYEEYPGNPNESDFGVAALCSQDGRHLAIMPHIERSLFPWNWPYYPNKHKDEISPWIEAFVNARNWVKTKLN